MNKDLTLYYAKYKTYLLPVVFIILGFFIVSRVIVPQLSTVGEKRQEISQKTDEIAVLEGSLNTMSKQDQDVLGEYLSVVGHALPTSKNIAIIFEALSSAAAAADADLNEFTLKVGGLYGRAEATSLAGRGTPSIEVGLRVDGADTESVVQFTREIQSRLPLSEVVSINTSGGFATVQMNFFYKPLNLLLIRGQDNVRPLSQADLDLLNELEGWDQ